MGSMGEPVPHAEIPLLDVDVLIVGAGPSGASLASFLGSYGVDGLMISDLPGPSEHPRASYFNMAGMECLREIGLEAKARQVAYPVADYSTYTRFCRTLAGEEVYRAYVFGNDPHRHGDYDDAGPSETLSLCQTHLEPILLQYASSHGFSTRWQTRLASFKDDTARNIVTSVLEDMATGQTYAVRSKYLIAADGAKSQIARALDIPMIHGPGNGFVISVWVEADLGHLVKPAPGLLHYLCVPDKAQPEYGPLGIAHFLKPWNEWVISLFPHPSYQKLEATEEQVMARVKELIGDDTVEYKVKGTSVWDFDEVYAQYYSHGNVHCVGNAVHRHPPFGGLGTSTCMEDSFNLAWKIAHVLQGKAGRSLLSTYNEERQPAGEYVVQRTNENGRLNFKLYGMLGYLDLPDSDRRSTLADLMKEDSAEGETMRADFRKAVQGLADEHHCVGAMMNQWYRSSALYVEDDMQVPEWPQTESERASKLYTSTYPGWRVPHAWLSERQPKAGPRKPLVSTRDLVGHGRFTVLTGIGGKSVWAPAACSVGKGLGLDISVLGIGFGQDYEDTFFRWSETREVSERGAVLVRPDRTVAWRATAPPGDALATEGKLEKVLRSILGLQQHD